MTTFQYKLQTNAANYCRDTSLSHHCNKDPFIGTTQSTAFTRTLKTLILFASCGEFTDCVKGSNDFEYV